VACFWEIDEYDIGAHVATFAYGGVDIYPYHVLFLNFIISDW
jgi:hypothetical protein